MRTQPRFDDLHQWLRWRVNDLAVVHRTANPGTSMCLIWAHRSTEGQQLAYKAGRSKIDGIRRFSLHNYLPSLAADVWVYTNADPDDRDIYENRPPKSEGLRLQLLQRGSLKRWYIPMGKLAEEVGLESGALWRTFRDGPHVQVPKIERMKFLQHALATKGFDVGPIDGIIGRKTKAAIVEAERASGINGRLRRGLMPVTPSLWRWLHQESVS